MHGTCPNLLRCPAWFKMKICHCLAWWYMLSSQHLGGWGWRIGSWAQPGLHSVTLSHTQKKMAGARCWWLIPVILVTGEAESRRIMVGSQTVQETLSQKHLSQQKG
jgi:hypothetical protein